MKSAYERALEKLEAEGIARPSEDALSAEVKAEMATVRQKTQAKIAELEIMHRKALAAQRDPQQRREEEQRFRAERQRLERERDDKLASLRAGQSAS